MDFDRALTRSLVVPAGIEILLLALGVAFWAPRSSTTLLAVLGIAVCGAFSVSHIPHAIQLMVRDPAYRNFRNIGCVIAAAFPATVTVSLLVLLTWAMVHGFGQGDSVVFGGAGA
jgi:hypothetical protein